MSRGPCTFRQQDVKRALKATADAGMKIARIEIDKAGKIILVADDVEHPDNVVNEWDIVK